MTYTEKVVTSLPPGGAADRRAVEMTRVEEKP
jgi:hypothetical protein